MLKLSNSLSYFAQEVIIFGKIKWFYFCNYSNLLVVFSLTAEKGVGQEERMRGSPHHKYKTVHSLMNLLG